MAVKVVVMGRNYTSRLGMIRSAGMAGYDVSVLRTINKANLFAPDLRSKYVHEYYEVRERDDDGALQLLKEKFGGGDKAVLLPTDDYTASLIDERQDELEERFLYPNKEHRKGAMVDLMAKGLQAEIAREVGLAVPKCWTARQEGGRYAIPDGIQFPCFVKPEISIYGSKLIMKRCESPEELEQCLSNIAGKKEGSNAPCDLLIEEFVDFEKEYAVLGAANGEDVLIPAILETSFLHRGVAGAGRVKSFDYFPELRKRLERFIKRMNFQGLFDIDLFGRGDKVYFNELNLRVGASSYALTMAGVNLADVLVKILRKESRDLNHAAGMYGIREISFSNEKVCLQKYKANDVSWKEMRRIIDESDVHFVRSSDDRAPYREFRREAWKLRAKKVLKAFFGRGG